MANWAYTNYVIEGPKEDLQKIYNAIQEHPIKEKSSDYWEGNILTALGIDYTKVKLYEDREPYMRGFIDPDTVEFRDGNLIFSAEEAWGVTDFCYVLKEKMSEVKVYWCTEEPNEHIYATNDKEGKYFLDKVYVDCYINGNYSSEYFTSEEDAYEWLSELTKSKMTCEEDIENLNDKYDSDTNNEDFIHFCVFDVVD